MKQVADFAYLTEQIAFLCGLWNGLVDFVAGIFKFLGILLQAPYDMADNFQDVLEAIDDFREAWAAFSFKDFFITAMRLHADILAELIQFFTDPNPRENYNFDVIAYYSGFGVAFIASFFIPAVNIAKVSSIAKFSKFIPEEFVATLNVARTQGVKGFKAMVRLLEDIAEFLGRKGDELYQELKKLLDKLLAWIKKNKKRFEKIDNFVDENILRRFIRRNHIKGDIDVAYVLRISNNRKDLAESLLLSLKEVKEGKTVIQLVRYFKITDPPVLASLSNYQARIWYSWKKMQIEKQIKRIKKLEDKAKKAFELRNEYRTATRQYMKDRNWADYLEQVEKNMTWEEILERTLRKDKINSLEQAYREIIKKSMSGRDNVDDLFKLKY